eukprot:6179969-Pleurochrysis_carterae.AAC.3
MSVFRFQTALCDKPVQISNIVRTRLHVYRQKRIQSSYAYIATHASALAHGVALRLTTRAKSARRVVAEGT